MPVYVRSDAFACVGGCGVQDAVLPTVRRERDVKGRTVWELYVSGRSAAEGVQEDDGLAIAMLIFQFSAHETRPSAAHFDARTAVT